MTATQNIELGKIKELISKIESLEYDISSPLSDDEITEQQLFCFIKVRDRIKDIVIDMDPNRFGPIRSYQIQTQELTVNRLNLCTLCGSTRCQSDHK